jgi:hypothetical protein
MRIEEVPSGAALHGDVTRRVAPAGDHGAVPDVGTRGRLGVPGLHRAQRHLTLADELQTVGAADQPWGRRDA